MLGIFYAGLRFQAWLDALHYPAATDKHTMDRPLCAEIEDLWLSGEEKSLVGDTIPAVQFFIMRRRILSGASAKDDPQRQVERFPLCPQCTSWIFLHARVLEFGYFLCRLSCSLCCPLHPETVSPGWGTWKDPRV